MVKEIDGVKRINNCQELLWGTASTTAIPGDDEKDQRHEHTPGFNYQCSNNNPELCGKYHHINPSKYYESIQQKCRIHDNNQTDCNNNIFCKYTDENKCQPKIEEIKAEETWSMGIMKNICGIEGSKCKVLGEDDGTNPNSFKCTYDLEGFSKGSSIFHLWVSISVLLIFMGYTMHNKWGSVRTMGQSTDDKQNVIIAIVIGIILLVCGGLGTLRLHTDLDCNKYRYPQFIEGLLALYIVLYSKNAFLQKTYVKVYVIVSFLIILGIRIETTLSAGVFGQEYNIINMFPYLSTFSNVMRRNDHNNNKGGIPYSMIILIMVLVWGVLFIKYPEKTTGNWKDRTLIGTVFVIGILFFCFTMFSSCDLIYEQTKEDLPYFIDPSKDEAITDITTTATGDGKCYAGKISGSRDYDEKVLELKGGETIDIKCKNDYEGGGKYKCVNLEGAKKDGPSAGNENFISVLAAGSDVRIFKNYLPWKINTNTKHEDCATTDQPIDGCTCENGRPATDCNPGQPKCDSCNNGYLINKAMTKCENEDEMKKQFCGEKKTKDACTKQVYHNTPIGGTYNKAPCNWWAAKGEPEKCS